MLNLTALVLLVAHGVILEGITSFSWEWVPIGIPIFFHEGFQQFEDIVGWDWGLFLPYLSCHFCKRFLSAIDFVALPVCFLAFWGAITGLMTNSAYLKIPSIATSNATFEFRTSHNGLLYS
jgi:hypothetical protein